MVEQPQRIGREWIRSESGKYVESMNEDDEGKIVVDCKILLPPSLSPSLFLLEVAPVDNGC